MKNEKPQIKIKNYKKPFLRSSFRFLSIVFIFSFLFFNYHIVDAAILYIDPPEAEIYVGDTFVADLRIDTQGEVVNTIGTSIFALGDELAIADLSVGQSVFPMLVRGPEFSDSGNSVSFSAVVLDGFEGEGTVGRIFLRADKPGFTMARISLDSQVFLHDGEGTEAEMHFGHAEYFVTDIPEEAPPIVSDTHPISSRWYREDRARITWSPKEGASYFYAFSTNSQAEPDIEVGEGVGEVELDISEDGVYYFRLSECFTEGCSPIITRTIMKDATPPREFEVFLGHGHEAYDGNIFISFSATDDTSGVERYEVQEDESDWMEAESPYVLRDQNARIVRVKAIDKAGNERVSELNIKAQISGKGYGIPPFVGIIILVTGALAVGFVYMRKRKVIRNT